MTGENRKNRKHRKIDLDFAFDSETVGFYQSIGIQAVSYTHLWAGAAICHLTVWGDRIFEKCGIRRDEEGDGGKTLEIDRKSVV